jgi:alpha-L-rhamnosidase
MTVFPEKMRPDPRVRRFLRPKTIVWQQGGGKLENPEALLEGHSGICRMHGGGGKNPAILLDFGQEIHGGIRLTNGMSKGHQPVRLRITFGESADEAMGQPNQDHAIHNQEILAPWYGYAEFGNTGFRFARIELAEDAELELTELVAVFIYRDLPWRGSFTCNDARLNTIWRTGAYSVHLCMQDMLWDGIKRDRLVWIGDMHPETMVVNTVFGETDVVPASLDYVRDITPLPKWMNGISSYSLWWVLIHRCWYQYHGNRDYLEKQRGYLKGLLNQLLEQIGDDNRERMGNHRFLDWPSSEDESAIHAGLHALLRMGLRDGAALCAVLGEGALRAQCLDGAERLGKYLPPPTPSKQANALLALADLVPAEKANAEVLAKDPLHELSTFYGYYVLQARAMAGDYEGALHVIRNFWGAMLDLGATTFWEDFNLRWKEDNPNGIESITPEGRKSIHADYGNYCYKGLRHSLCHGWAAGPTAWLSEHVLGFRPLEAGCSKLAIQPHLGDLESAEGTFPTPKGAVSVKHTKTASGEIRTEYDAPEGIEIVL